MKRLKYLILSLSLLIASSCQNLVDIGPKTILTPEVAFSSLNDFNLGLRGVYSALGGMIPTYIASTDYVSDDLRRGLGNLGGGVFFYNYVFTAGEGGKATIWAGCYNAIYRANLIIEQLEPFEVSTPADQATKSRILGEAYGVRALAHFYLVGLFARPFNATAGATHLGVPVVNQVLPSGAKPARNTVAEVYAQIEADIATAKNLLANIPFNNKAMNLPALFAFSARVALYKQDYARAASEAQEAITRFPNGLTPRATYIELWEPTATLAELDGEVIFKLDFQIGDPRIGDAYWGRELGIAQWAPSNDLVSLYDQANDARFNAFFRLNGATNNNTNDDIVYKYPGTVANPGLNDPKFFRLSEVYLILAEARARGGIDGGDAAALLALDEVRAARIDGFVSPGESGLGLINAIMTERRKELAYEGHRYIDLRRTGTPLIRVDCNATPGGCDQRGPGDFRYDYFAIPQSEIFANENIEQNLGY